MGLEIFIAFEMQAFMKKFLERKKTLKMDRITCLSDLIDISNQFCLALNLEWGMAS